MSDEQALREALEVVEDWIDDKHDPEYVPYIMRLEGAITELAALRPLREAIIRYGRALQIVRMRDGSIVDVDVAAYDEWRAALEVLDARALALVTEEGPG